MLDIDLDKITTEVEKVLDWYAIPYEHRIVRYDIVDTWFNRKRALLETFSKHPNWDNDTCSVLFKIQYDRPVDIYAAQARAERLFAHYFTEKRENDPCLSIVKYTHDEEVVARFIANSCNFRPKIDIDNQTYWFLAAEAADMKEPYRQFPVGLRTSRGLARLFKHFGIDKMTDYEKHFAQLADAVSPLTIDRTTALSFHPCDYLQMSHGTGWKSCHRIDGGEWQGGTWSYMLDEVTSILSTTEENNHGNMYNRPKVNRMVVCFDGGEILFSRLYPNYTDFAIRDTFRNVVQEIYAKCLDVPNLWQPPMRYNKYHSHYCDDDTLSPNFVTSGVGHMQYPDYDYAEYNCELSVLKGREPHVMEIGTWGICPVTGDEYEECGNMTSLDGHMVYCEHCGRRIDEDDAYYDDYGTAYCRDCWDELFSTCECCGEDFRNTEMTETQDGYVCQRCLEENYVECYECGEWVHTDNAITDVDGHWYCKDCAEDNLTRCDDCGEYYHNDDMTVLLHPVHGFVMALCPDCYEQALEDAKNEEEVEINA